MIKYAFWNNKGGTGKTSLAFQSICEYARSNSTKKILVVDLCPQANLSELLLGGIVQSGNKVLLARQGASPRSTIGGYFQERLTSPFSKPNFVFSDFITKPSAFNRFIPTNIDLLCGDPLLELQGNSMATLANTQVPGVNTWISVMDWLKDFFDETGELYENCFLDLNPSFSIYTQIALANTDRLVMPTMADDSSRRAVLNAFSLIYGLRLPSPIYASHNFESKMKQANRKLPQVHLIVQNRITQYMGNASAYKAVLDQITNDISVLLKHYPQYFTFNSYQDGVIDTRDFQTTGVVAFARGCPFYRLTPGYVQVLTRRVRVNQGQLEKCVDEIAEIVDRL